MKKLFVLPSPDLRKLTEHEIVKVKVNFNSHMLKLKASKDGRIRLLIKKMEQGWCWGGSSWLVFLTCCPWEPLLATTLCTNGVNRHCAKVRA